MKEELPRVFKSPIDKDINNNSEYFVSKNEEIKLEPEIKNDKSINQKINEIFKSYKYVYKADVIITTNEGEMTKRIIGKNGNKLITIDNELIDINKIKDIKFKE